METHMRVDHLNNSCTTICLRTPDMDCSDKCLKEKQPDRLRCLRKHDWFAIVKQRDGIFQSFK